MARVALLQQQRHVHGQPQHTARAGRVVDGDTVPPLRQPRLCAHDAHGASLGWSGGCREGDAPRGQRGGPIMLQVSGDLTETGTFFRQVTALALQCSVRALVFHSKRNGKAAEYEMLRQVGSIYIIPP